MARYIDADALIESIQETLCSKCDKYDGIKCKSCGIDDTLDFLDTAPTADVVTKSEVEELIYKLECLLCHATGGKLSKHTYDLMTMEAVVTDYIDEAYSEGVENGYKKCSAEIFEEIEFDIHQLMFERDETRAIAIEGVIANLKKKWTQAKEG